MLITHVRKLQKKINFMARIGSCLSVESKLLIFNTIILPHFNYCSTVLFLANSEHKNKLQKLQNKSMRVILNKNKFTSIKIMLSELKWLCIDKFLLFSVLVFVYKIVNKLVPKYLGDKLLKHTDIHGYNTRNKDNYCIAKPNSEAAKNSIFVEAVKLYNELPCELKDAPNLIMFKKKLKNNLLFY